MRIFRYLIWAVLVLAALGGGVCALGRELGVQPTLPSLPGQDPLPLDRLRLPPGYAIGVLARVPGARSLCLSPRGTLFVGTRGDQVYALADAGAGRPGRLYTVASGLREPNGVAFRDGDLYVAAVDRVLRYSGVEDRLDHPPSPEVVEDGLPGDSRHGWRYAAFGPDGLLYIGVGAPCNACARPDPFATIVRLKPGGGYEVFARGIRNTVGLAWRPSTGVLWFTNNGRDWLGNDQPPDSLHRAPGAGLDFGFPACHAGVPDPDLNHGQDCAQYAPTAWEFPAHVAPLGLRFYTGRMFPAQLRGAILVAEHGSWNRTPPVGYQVRLLRLTGDKVVSSEPFISGWLTGTTAWGRPVDVEVDQTGALLISDDRAGVIYRVTYQAP
ncbi:MAG: PQQ-dependent sugar dehydrogenase [Deltaproteobacteria bacterium]|nr:PQQ-dependent sugar dehydrogenase [Deltaproteobacteria bacterium]